MNNTPDFHFPFNKNDQFGYLASWAFLDIKYNSGHISNVCSFSYGYGYIIASKVIIFMMVIYYYLFLLDKYIVNLLY